MPKPLKSTPFTDFISLGLTVAAFVAMPESFETSLDKRCICFVFIEDSISSRFSCIDCAFVAIFIALSMSTSPDLSFVTYLSYSVIIAS